MLLPGRLHLPNRLRLCIVATPATYASVLLQGCASWTASSPQLHAFSHLLLGWCDAPTLRRSREDVLIVLNSASSWTAVSPDACDDAALPGKPQCAAADVRIHDAKVECVLLHC
jgi:hypothetical protein